MQKLKEVEAAKTLMREAVDWSVMHWLAEKKKVRHASDRANDALDALNRQVKEAWPEALRGAYAELSTESRSEKLDHGMSAENKAFVRKVKQANDEAYRARMDAEDTFDAAERRLSTSMAREGTQKAILSWELYEKAIALAEGAPVSKRTA